MKRLLLLLSIGFLNLDAMQNSVDPFTERVDSILERPQSPEDVDHLVIHVEVAKPAEMGEDEWLEFLWKNELKFPSLPCITGKDTRVNISIKRCNFGTRLWARLPKKLVGLIIAKKSRVKDAQLLRDLILEEEQKSFNFVAEPDSPTYQEANEWYCRAMRAIS